MVEMKDKSHKKLAQTLSQPRFGLNEIFGRLNDTVNVNVHL